jgi:hypothetical protein
MNDPQTISREQVENAQRLLDDAGLDAKWFVTSVNGSANDVLARYRAERILPGGRAFSVTHDEPRVLLDLCREADARFSTAPSAVVQVSNGTIDTINRGG